MSYDYSFKLIIVGDSNVGKSSIASRFQYNKFMESYEITVGLEFFSKIIKVNDMLIKIQIWDTAGQEMYRSLIKSYFRGSLGCIFVFDLTDDKSFKNMNYWIEKVKKDGNSFTTFCLVGNKSDKINQRKINFDDALELAIKYDMDYIETSALNSRNIHNLFYCLADKIMNNYFDNLILDDSLIKKGKQTNKFKIKDDNDSSCC